MTATSFLKPRPLLALRLLLALLLLVGLGIADVAHALTTKECTDAHFGAQVARSQGKLLQAEELLSMCGDPSCPGVLTAECGPWLKEVASEIPSVVVVVEDSRGQDILDFGLKVDGTEVPTNQVGAQRLDPGRHELEVTAAGYVTRTQEVRVRVGEKLRRIRLLMADAEPYKVAPRRKAWPLVLSGGLVVAGGTGFAVFGLMARSGEDDLEMCSPVCSESDVSRVRAKYVAANVSLGIGIAALVGGGLYFAFTSSRDSEHKSSGEERATVSTFAPRVERLSVSTSERSHGLSLTGSF